MKVLKSVNFENKICAKQKKYKKYTKKSKKLFNNKINLEKLSSYIKQRKLLDFLNLSLGSWVKCHLLNIFLLKWHLFNNIHENYDRFMDPKNA